MNDVVTYAFDVAASCIVQFGVLSRDLGPVRDRIDTSCGLCFEFLLGTWCIRP